MSKPREWWVSDEQPSPPKIFSDKPDWSWPATKLLVHVIEHEAYAALLAEAKEASRNMDRLERSLARVLRAVEKNTSHDFFEYCKGKAELERGE